MINPEKTFVIDTESDGLLREATRFWVAVSLNFATGDEFIFVDPKHDFIDHLEKAECVIMHNALGHDRPLIQKLLNYEIPKEKIIDTLVLSKFNNPDRRVPSGWTGTPKPHSVEAWGMRFGIPKPKHEDWSQYSDEMLHRCREDTRIQLRVTKALLKEFRETYK